MVEARTISKPGIKSPSEGETETLPRGLVVAGMGGGSGKSVVAVGLTAALAQRGKHVVPFKKGPDYIDAGWLSLAAGKPCYNLDQYLMSPEAIGLSFHGHATGAELVIVEGNRGLYDGVDVRGSFSTAVLAKSLGLPVLLVVDCTKTTRTVAAMVLGCKHLDPDVRFAGVVLNRIGTARHENLVRQAVEQYTGIPVLGAVPRSRQDVFPQRHLGVTPCPEHEGADDALSALVSRTEQYLDIDAIVAAMSEISGESPADSGEMPEACHDTPRIGILKDAAFQFYYAENLEALERAGAELVEINALLAPRLPEIDALYIGGGFPETSARQLAANSTFRQSVREAARQGLPIYAECGGLIYLGESMELAGEVFPLTGVLPVRFGLEKKPQAHGYTRLVVEGDNPFYPVGTEIRGHEFRYSTILANGQGSEGLVMKMQRGVGFANGREGLVTDNVLALYTHVHAVGTPEWAPGIVRAARRFAGRG